MTIVGSKCVLKTRTVSDFEWFWFWQNNGEWRNFDAPWEYQNIGSKEKIFEKYIKRVGKENLGGFNRLWIAVNDKKIGSVSAYNDINGNSIKIGIGIYDDKYQNKGIGTEALNLWMYYLFSKKYHKLGLDTYTFNERMIKVAEGTGFKLEGTEREIRKWNNEYEFKMKTGKIEIRENA